MPTQIVARIDPARSVVEARTSRGHRVVMDAGPPEGDDSAASPKETVLSALAACTAMDVASILRKKRQSATGYEIVVTGTSADDHPRVYTTITVEHRVIGEVEPEAVRRSVELSSTKYCPVSAMLAASVTIEHWYRLNDPDATGDAVLVAVTGPRGAQVL
jgi:putative redox protein